MKAKDILDERRNRYFERAKEMDANTKAIELNPNDTDALYKRGINSIVRSDYNSAINDFDKVLEINNNYKEAYYQRGYAYEKNGDTYSALRDYTKSIVLIPSDSMSYYRRGVVRIELNQKEGGCADFSKAVEMGEYFANVFFNKYCN